jgi:formiminoglutamase
MASIAPGISPDAKNNKRPKFCLSNNDGKAASQTMMDLLASCISESYGIERDDISLNDPFHGGYITKTYGNNPVPWIQIEMNRDLYLADPWFDKETLSVDLAHLKKLNKQFENTLNLFFENFYGVSSWK